MTTKDGTQHHHRSSLKQKNKPFKGGVRSKSRGRVESTSRSSSGKSGRTINSTTMSKADRRNHSNLLQAIKRSELNQERRIFSGKNGVPRNVVFVALSPSVCVSEIARTLSNSLDESDDFVTFVEEHRQNIRWLSTQFNDWTIMDRICSGDVVVFVVDARDETCIDERYFELLSVIRAQGISSAIGLVQSDLALSKQQKEGWEQFFQVEMSSISKLYFLNSGERERAELVRALCSQRINGVSWREKRPYLIVEEAEQEGDLVKIVGYSRGGQPFSANRIVHIPSVGTFEVDRITLASSNQQNREGMEVDCLEQVCDPLVSEKLENIIDILPSSATDMNIDMDIVLRPSSNKKRVKVPKGTSSYQAAWLSDISEASEEEEEVELSQDEGSEASEDDEEAIDEDDPHEREAHRISPKLSKDYPDLLSLEADKPARIQLANYRGLQSLRTAQWDPEENLPAEYEHIYQFENPARSIQKAMETPSDTPFSVGQRLCIYLKNCSLDIKGKAVYGLLPHEQCTSLLHFTVTPRHGALINRGEVVAWIGGIRRFITEPVYSEHNPSASLFRQLRTVEPGQTAIASIYAPIHYTGPVLLFSLDGKLLSVGSVFAAADPRRTILQRATLTGAPYKIHKRSAVVRWMFDSPSDVTWFKPVELCTKSGRRGNIKESLGTHGHFKALFDKPLLASEPIAMHLYKRIFPRWNSTRPI